MLGFILRRLLVSIVVLAFATLLVFMLVANSGDPLALLRNNPKVPHAVIAARIHLLHLDKPVVDRYFIWLNGLFHGTFGPSVDGQAVGPLLISALLITLRLVVAAVIVAAVLAIVLGVVAAVRQYSITDYVSTFASFLFFATPAFVIGVALKEFLAIKVNQAFGGTFLFTIGPQSPVLPPDLPHQLGDYLGHLALPALTLILTTYAAWSRYQRSSMLDVLNSDYLRLARAKGLSPRRVLVRHGLRNALIPITTIIALDFSALLSGVIITETIFGWDGLGTFYFGAVVGLDINKTLAWLLLSAVLIILFNLLADVVYAYLDPRIRYA